MDTTSRLAAAVAEAADAWLKDPRDVNVYQRLVDATMRWRAHAQPELQPVDEPTAELEPAAALTVTWPTTSSYGCRAPWPTASVTWRHG